MYQKYQEKLVDDKLGFCCGLLTIINRFVALGAGKIIMNFIHDIRLAQIGLNPLRWSVIESGQQVDCLIQCPKPGLLAYPILVVSSWVIKEDNFRLICRLQRSWIFIHISKGVPERFKCI